jgi:hypothetical protein
MNNHAGWSQDGRCVWCFSNDASKPCLDPNSEEFRIQIITLTQELKQTKDDRDWWQKKHQEDSLTMRIIGRREGAHEMQNKIRDLVWACRFDDFLDSEIASLEYKEDHAINCSWWRDWHECSCGTFDTKSNKNDNDSKEEEYRMVLNIILQADMLKEHAFDRGDDDASIYEMIKNLLEKK